jgi:hypothetical protein
MKYDGSIHGVNKGEEVSELTNEMIIYRFTAAQIKVRLGEHDFASTEESFHKDFDG